jgi:hypothetical protein
MSSKIILKKSGVLGKVPQNTDLEYGEVALNYADGKLYFKNTSNVVQSISAGALGVDSAATISLINQYVDSAYINSIVDANVDSAKVMAIIDSAVNQTFINNLDVNAGTLDGQDGTYYLDYNNFTNKPTAADFRDSAFVASIASTTPGPVDSASITNLIDNDYVATIVDSAYIAIRVGEFAQNFGTVAVVGDLSIDATTGGDTITFAAGSGVSITTNTAQKRVTISSTSNQVFDFGTFTQPVGFTLDMGAI